MRQKRFAAIIVLALLGVLSPVELFGQSGDEELLRTRETVWRAWFAGDTATLKELVPAGTIVMSGGEEAWKGQAEVLQSSAEFHAKGGRLVSLKFPRTEVQHFGDVAIVWSSYVVEVDVGGKRSQGESRVTEIFVRENGRWKNPGWHTDDERMVHSDPAAHQ